jgi:hypothetical protein
VDVSHARVEPAAMEQLQACSKSHHLPASIDPLQSECNISVLAPASMGSETPVGMRSRAMSLAA